MRQIHLRQVHELAGRQHGAVSRRQLLKAGVSASSVGRAVQSGILLPLHRGVYLYGSARSPFTRFAAAVLACSPSAYLSHSSAARLWGVLEDRQGTEGARPRSIRSKPGTNEPTKGPVAARLDPVHVTLVDSDRGRRSGIRPHRVRSLGKDETATRNGLPVTCPGRTLADLAAIADLRTLERVAGACERYGLLDGDAFEALLVRYRGRRGIQRLRSLLGVEGGAAFTRSEAESRLLDLIRRSGLPHPVVNQIVGPWELDFYWADGRVAVEVDGWEYHSSRDRFKRDRRKDTWLRSRGIIVLRFTWDQIVHEPCATLAHLAAVLGRAAESSKSP